MRAKKKNMDDTAEGYTARQQNKLKYPLKTPPAPTPPRPASTDNKNSVLQAGISAHTIKSVNFRKFLLLGYPEGIIEKKKKNAHKHTKKQPSVSARQCASRLFPSSTAICTQP